MDGFFTIFKKAVSELICTRLYISDDQLFVTQGVAQVMADTDDSYLHIAGGPGATDIFR